MTTSSTESGLVTILFTDLVGSTELLSRAGDEEAQRIFRAHHDLLSETAASHGGQEVKWLGDGLMVAFPSAAGALRAAIAMQQASRRPVEGERLSIRVGLNAGEALRDAADYFGTAVVVARRLCDSAEGGQILCTETVAGLLHGQRGFTFADLGKLTLKGVPQPVAACEVRYEADVTQVLAARLPVVGRDAEVARLTAWLGEVASGRGGLAMITGDAGIGKTRMLEEVSERAERSGMLVLTGRCFESEWTPPYAPFAEALDAHVATVDPEELRADLGPGAAPLAQLVPAVRQVLPGVPDPVPLQPDEERFRLLDAVAQFLVARSRRAPVLVCLDDLHWADKGTVAMLRHVDRLASRHRILLLGAYRDAEVDRAHPLAEVLGALRREAEYESVPLDGLDAAGVAQLLALFGEHDVEEKVGAAWAGQTDGNPLFVKELLRYLIEEGSLYRGSDGRWTTDRPLRELGLPPGVRDVIARRLSRLSEAASRLLTVASVFEGPFDFEVVAAVAGLPDDDALDALDEALSAQVLRPTGGAEIHAFAHTLVREAVYGELSSPRQVRFHRRVAEVLEAAYGGHPNAAQAGEIALQYHRSRSLPGAERGVEPALVAAGYAEATGAHDEAARFLRMALELLPEGDPRRPRLLGRLGVALVWSRAFDEAVGVVSEAGEGIATSEGADAAADYLAEAVYACEMAGSSPHGWGLARRGLEYAGDRRDLAWARLVSFDFQRREAEDPEHPGIPLDVPERWEAARILQGAHLDPMGPAPMLAVYPSRAEAATSTNLVVLAYWAGEYTRCLPLFEAEAEAALSRGQFMRAARCWAFAADCRTALGQLDEAHAALEQAGALAARVGQPVFVVLAAQAHLTMALDEGWEEFAPAFESLAASTNPALAWALGALWSDSACIAAHGGQGNVALRFLGLLVPWLERAPAWTVYFRFIAFGAAEALWLLERLDHIEVVQRAVREKVVEPDFRSPTVDGRLALARLCALTGRHDEALLWFAEARRVLDEQGARPLRAVADYDEALMYARRGGPGDADRARPLVDAARRQFAEIGMTGWLRRADQLEERLR